MNSLVAMLMAGVEGAACFIDSFFELSKKLVLLSTPLMRSSEGHNSSVSPSVQQRPWGLRADVSRVLANPQGAPSGCGLLKAFVSLSLKREGSFKPVERDSELDRKNPNL